MFNEVKWWYKVILKSLTKLCYDSLGLTLHEAYVHGIDAVNGNFPLFTFNHVVSEHGMEVRNGRGENNTMSTEQLVIHLRGNKKYVWQVIKLYNI